MRAATYANALFPAPAGFSTLLQQEDALKQQAITPGFGEIVEGVDLGDMGPPVLRRLYQIWQQRHLLVLRGPAVDAGSLEAFAATLGEIEALPVPAQDATEWDAEQSCAVRPSFACVLRCTQVPAAGGDTWFACLPQALRSMAPDLGSRLRWLALQHGSNVHPMVVMHPETGEPTLYLGARRHARITGVPPTESDRLLNIVWSYATASAVTYRHRWQPGDVVLWNNLTVPHRHEAVYGATARKLEGHRVKAHYTLSSPIQQEAA
jgi:alpha-ketoglutarate-dependent taurine dioxygenase